MKNLIRLPFALAYYFALQLHDWWTASDQRVAKVAAQLARERTAPFNQATDMPAPLPEDDPLLKIMPESEWREIERAVVAGD